MNTADQRREARLFLRRSSGCEMYDRPERCPLCGTKNMYRIPKVKVCYGCVKKGEYKA